MLVDLPDSLHHSSMVLKEKTGQQDDDSGSDSSDVGSLLDLVSSFSTQPLD